MTGSMQPSRVILRRASPSDVDDLVRLHLETVTVAYRDFFPASALRPSPEVLAGLWRRDLDDGHEVIVAIEDAQLVGSAIARSDGTLARLHVHPSRWRRGIGQLLHDRAIEALRDAAHAEAHLWVIEGNEPARTLYERAGWRLVPGEELIELGVKEVRYRLSL
jgi:GNAT superfamily N-acetyltransferase